MKKLATSRRGAFTLIEILVVIGIIALLAALLFPAFARARESARQANCASNLKDVYFAVNLYYQDTKRYPGSLYELLPDGAEYNNNGTTGKITTGTGYFKGGADILLCPDDEYKDVASSSYGALSPTVPPPTAGPTGAIGPSDDAGSYVFNYWGYKNDGFTYLNQSQAATAGNADITLLRNSAIGAVYDARNNPIKYSLSNVFAPSNTIITHCVYHRPQTAADLAQPTDLYGTIGNGAGARDIVLRLDGTAKVTDVSSFQNVNGDNKWLKQ